MRQKTEVKGLTRSEVVAVIAIVFLIVGYQTAVFINKAALSAIAAKRESPDTVYVIDPALAQRLLGEVASEHSPGLEYSGDRSPAGKSSDRKISSPPEHPGNGPVSGITIRKPAASRAIISGNASTSARSSAKVSSSARSSAKVSPSGRSSAKVAPSGRPASDAELFRFDPNKVSVEDLCRLGFSQRQAESIDAYRLKGGRFRRKSDFAKSYVVSDEMFARLEPYIDIPLLDLNLADSAAFDALPGVGGYFASRMVRYRNELRGYSTPLQLLEIRKFDSSKYELVRDLVFVNPSTVRPYPLWTLPEDSLRLHPYISLRVAHGIVIFRENNPREAWSVDALLDAGIIDPTCAEKLRSCILSPP